MWSALPLFWGDHTASEALLGHHVMVSLVPPSFAFPRSKDRGFKMDFRFSTVEPSEARAFSVRKKKKKKKKTGPKEMIGTFQIWVGKEIVARNGNDKRSLPPPPIKKAQRNQHLVQRPRNLRPCCEERHGWFPISLLSLAVLQKEKSPLWGGISLVLFRCGVCWSRERCRMHLKHCDADCQYQ